MAMMDYGALLRVDGVFINKNKGMFMDKSDSGYICNKVIGLDGEEMKIDGNYFVYAGDKDLMMVFYKGIFHAISDGKVINSGYNIPFLSETKYLNGLSSIKITHLSKENVLEYYEKLDQDDFEWFKRQYGTKNGTIAFHRSLKKSRKVAYKSLTGRWLASWGHNNKKYEVIFGYGIEPDEDVWNQIKNESYGFKGDEIKIIDSWFQS